MSCKIQVMPDKKIHLYWCNPNIDDIQSEEFASLEQADARAKIIGNQVQNLYLKWNNWAVHWKRHELAWTNLLQTLQGLCRIIIDRFIPLCAISNSSRRPLLGVQRVSPGWIGPLRCSNSILWLNCQQIRTQGKINPIWIWIACIPRWVLCMAIRTASHRCHPLSQAPQQRLDPVHLPSPASHCTKETFKPWGYSQTSSEGKNTF